MSKRRSGTSADGQRDGLERMRALVAGLRAIDASAWRDLDAVLDEVARQTCALLGADFAGVQLRVPGTDWFVRRRPSRLARPEASTLQAGLRFKPDALAREAIDTGRVLFVTAFQADDRIDPAVRQALPDVVSSMVAPMAAEGESVGFLFAHWRRLYVEQPGDAEIVHLLAQHAALVVRVARGLEEARRAHAEAEEAVRLRDEFLSVSAHELRTPITSLRGLTQLLLRQQGAGRIPSPERLGQALGWIDRQTGKLTRLIDRLLDVTRLQAGRLVLDREQTDVAALVRDVAAVAQVRTEIHAVTVQAPPRLDAWVDPVRLEQVVTNLVDNAVKFSPEGGPIEIHVDEPSPGLVRITVRDYGVGVAPEDRDHIFDRFYQAAIQHRTGGMGLGLYISRQIIELHGGTIEVQDADGPGARFVVVLPAAAADTSVSAAGSLHS